MLIVTKMSSPWQCEYEVAKSEFKLQACTCTQKRRTSPKVITHWKEEGPLSKGEEIINTPQNRVWEQRWHLRGVWAPAECAQALNRARPGLSWVVGGSLHFPGKGGDQGLQLSLRGWESAEGTVLKTDFGLSMWALFSCPFVPVVTSPQLAVFLHGFLAALWVSEFFKG